MTEVAENNESSPSELHVLFHAGDPLAHSIATTVDPDQPWIWTEPVQVGPERYGSILFDHQFDPSPATLVKVGPAFESMNVRRGAEWAHVVSHGASPAIQTCDAPTLFEDSGRQYLVWWNSLQQGVLSVAENTHDQQFSGFNTVDWLTASGGDGEGECFFHDFSGFCRAVGDCKPSVTRFGNQVHILTSCYIPGICAFEDGTPPDWQERLAEGPVRLSRNATQAIGSFWSNHIIELGKHLSSDPVLQSFKDRLYIFFDSTEDGGYTIYYRHSENGLNWSETFELPIDPELVDLAAEVGGYPGNTGQSFQVARLGERLAVIYRSGIEPDDGGGSSELLSVVVSLYE